MSFRSSYLSIALTLALPALGSAQTLYRFQHFPSDSGTGPFLQAVSSGMSDSTDGPGLAHLFPDHLFDHFEPVFTALGAIQTPGLTDSDIDKVRTEVNKLNAYLGSNNLAPADFGQLLRYLNSHVAVGTFDKATAYQFARGAELDFVWSVYRRVAVNLPGQLAARVKVGAYMPTGATYGFINVTEPLFETVAQRARDWRVAAFLTGTGLGASGSQTARLGGGVLTGDPNQLILGASLASYVSPGATDAELNLALKLRSSHVNQGGRTSFGVGAPLSSGKAIWMANREGHLLDPIRPDDIWLSADTRWIWNSNSVPPGHAYTGTLTWALPAPSYASHNTVNPITATTLSLSGTYCQQHALHMDEFAAELRVPVDGFYRKHPAYMSVRLGTRLDATVAVEFRL